MDSITHAVVGAAIGQLALPPSIGKKRLILGAIIASLPDLDFIFYPFFGDLEELALHRTASHSLLAILSIPIMVWIVCLYRQYRNRGLQGGVTPITWASFWWWCLFSHVALDCFTTYGTGIYWPFSDKLIALDNLFIVDPLLTVPLIICCWFILRKDEELSRRKAALISLLIGGIYIAFTLGSKSIGMTTFENSLHQKNIAYEKLVTLPTNFNSILWRGIAKTSDGYYDGYFSVFDNDYNIEWQYTARNEHLLNQVKAPRLLDLLIWKMHDFYAVEKQGASIVINDIRYGKLLGWLPSPYIFSYRLTPQSSGDISYVAETAKIDPRIAKNNFTQHFLPRLFGYKFQEPNH